MLGLISNVFGMTIVNPISKWFLRRLDNYLYLPFILINIHLFISLVAIIVVSIVEGMDVFMISIFLGMLVLSNAFFFAFQYLARLMGVDKKVVRKFEKVRIIKLIEDRL